jgi:hypothetical protein
MTNLERIQAKARELARSGKFHGWRPIAFELRFEEGYEEARAWLRDAATQDELDRLCQTAREAKNEAAWAKLFSEPVIALHLAPLVRRMKTRAPTIAKIWLK